MQPSIVYERHSIRSEMCRRHNLARIANATTVGGTWMRRATVCRVTGDCPLLRVELRYRRAVSLKLDRRPSPV